MLHYTSPGIWELYYMRIVLTVELYYMRILLIVKKGCMRYRCIKTINGHTYDTFQEARSALGLLDVDREFIDCITENGKRTSLTDFKSMHRADAVDMPTFTNKLIIDELNYNKVELEKTHADMLLILTDEQRCVHDKIMESVGSDDSGFFFSYGYGGGRTARSTPTVPIEINEASSLTMEKESPRADLMRAPKLIIWDETPMMHRWCFEAVDRSLCDIMSKNDPLKTLKPFGGMTVVLGGDFRQILPVFRGGTRPDIVDASDEITNFCKWILSIGDDNDASGDNGEMKVEIPEDLLMSDTTNPLMSLIDFNDNLGDQLFFQERGILAPTLDSVEHVNEFMMSLIPGEEKELKLKVGCPVMLMRNIDQANGLCNGTRLTVTHLGKSTIAATDYPSNSGADNFH
ncbi:PIF1-like helicase [Medicago truncatula]|uniref:ATP-dependent DNA helicase n=1 Tax=Medicago truncatula TaxID=3880 RepID=A0A072TRP4_MEDTR|nr:PIF1-like helicase [Medicago truncatula]